MAEGGRFFTSNGARLAGAVWLLFSLLVFRGAGLSGAASGSLSNAGGGISLESSPRNTRRTSHSSAHGRRGHSLYGQRGHSGSFRPQNNDAISRLSKVFGIDRVPVYRRHRSPPQYMVELYNTVAYHNGITRTQSPYGSDVVRGFPDRASREHMVFYFNVSYIHHTEKVLQGEFRVFRLRPRPPEAGTRLPRGIHLLELRLYQILDPRSESLKLLDFRRVSTQMHGWEVFKVKNTVQEWVNDSTRNYGLLVEATTLGGSLPVNGSYFRLAQRSQHHDSKQPVLVVFTEDRRHHHMLDDAGSDLLPEEERRSTSRRAVSPINREAYVQYLNERYRAKHRNYRLFPSSSKTYQWPQQAVPTTSHEPHQMSSAPRRRSRRAVEFYNTPRKRKETCSRHELYVDFDEIGWSGWIISPKGYNAYHCKGECPFPLGQNQKPTNHATVQSIVHALRIGKGVGTPCCVPNKLYSFSLLYFDDDENVILKRYDDMVAASCGCH